MGRIIFLLVAVVFAVPLRAVENMATSTFNLAAPTSSDIPNWASGWTQPTVQPTGYAATTGWNYVGTVGGNSAVYMGNNWVLTAGHVGTGVFNLNGISYPMVASSTHSFDGVDLVLFQISPAPDLPGVPVRSSAPAAVGPGESGNSPVAIIGWGAGGGSRFETWGYNNPINYIDQTISVTANGTTYTSNDFATLTETTSAPPKETGNPYEVQVGDSGGADFIYNSTTSRWELAGINEGNNGTSVFTYSDGATGGYSVFVQLNTYSTTINSVIAQPLPSDSPTLPVPGLVVMAGLLVLAASPTLGRSRMPSRG